MLSGVRPAVAHVPGAEVRSFLQTAPSINQLMIQKALSLYGSASDAVMKKLVSVASLQEKPSTEPRSDNR